MTTSVGHKPEAERWVFDEGVTECFDDMLVRSIPLYEEMLDLVAALVARHIRPGDTIIDLGVSSGNALSRITERLAERKVANVRLVGVDNSKSMLKAARARLPESAELIEADLSREWPYRLTACEPKVILCLYTAQFIPLERRAEMFRNARGAISDGGCMFVAEKLRGQTSRHQDVMATAYSKWKVAQGYTEEDVLAKAQSLEGVLVSLSAPEQLSLIHI